MFPSMVMANADTDCFRRLAVAAALDSRQAASPGILEEVIVTAQKRRHQAPT